MWLPSPMNKLGFPSFPRQNREDNSFKWFLHISPTWGPTDASFQTAGLLTVKKNCNDHKKNMSYSKSSLRCDVGAKIIRWKSVVETEEDIFPLLASLWPKFVSHKLPKHQNILSALNNIHCFLRLEALKRKMPPSTGNLFTILFVQILNKQFVQNTRKLCNISSKLVKENSQKSFY